MILRQRGLEEYCRRDDLPATAMTTVVKAPVPAPRKISGNSSNRRPGQRHNQSTSAAFDFQRPQSTPFKPFHSSVQFERLRQLTSQGDMLRFQQHDPLNPTNLSNSDQANISIKHLTGKPTSDEPQASEEQMTNDSTGDDDDTEDSTDQKPEKPKPGKLDLSQFNNITNAIGKLNIQPVNSKYSSDHGQHSGISSPKQQHQESSSREGGFFKNRNKKAKSKLKEPPETVTSLKQRQEFNEQKSDDQLVSFRSSSSSSSARAKLASSTNAGHNKSSAAFGGVENKSAPSTEVSFAAGRIKPAELFSSGKSGVSDSATEHSFVQRIEVKDRPDKCKSPPVEKSTLRTSSFGSTAIGQDQADTELVAATISTSKMSRADVIPRPAPRSVSQLSSAAITKSQQQPQQQQQQSPSIVSTAFSGGKRINNPRQNHGRAVAPPQLPPGRKFDADSGSSASDIPLAQQIEESVARQQKQSIDDGSIDFSQSPIAQRLLKHSKDYKVSELNSPYESDSDYSQLAGAPKLQKFTRGQSFGSETTTTVTSASPASQFINSSIDSTELANSRGAAIKQLNEILANKQPLGRLGGPQQFPSRSSSLDQQEQGGPQPSKKSDKDIKKDKKKLRDDEKLEKRRLKEEERLRRQEKKLAAKKSKSGSLTSSGSVGDDGVPLFIRRCIEFIEYEGLDAEGIYRVPGNRAHVDAFVQKFKENPDMSIVESDIPVNAVATALKDFLSKKWGPIIPLNLMDELTELSNISEKERRVIAVRELVNKLPSANYKLLRFLFSHFVRISLNCSMNSMDSKNLAICWWPTLLPLHFNDMVMFEQMRPHLEESIQTMIDQYDFIFDNEEPAPSTAPPKATSMLPK